MCHELCETRQVDLTTGSDSSGRICATVGRTTLRAVSVSCPKDWYPVIVFAFKLRHTYAKW